MESSWKIWKGAGKLKPDGQKVKLLLKLNNSDPSTLLSSKIRQQKSFLSSLIFFWRQLNGLMDCRMQYTCWQSSTLWTVSTQISLKSGKNAQQSFGVKIFRKQIWQCHAIGADLMSTQCTQCNWSGWKGPSRKGPVTQSGSVRLTVGRQIWATILPYSKQLGIMAWLLDLGGMGHWSSIVPFLGLLSAFRFDI